MQLISAASAPPRRPVGAIVSGTLVGATLVAGGLSLAYLAFATPLLALLMPTGRLDTGAMASGMIVMALALVAPMVFIAVGTTRLAKLVASLRPLAAHKSLLERLAADLPSDVVGASEVTLYDGRSVPAMLIGSFGVVVLRDLPRASLTRRTGASWELRTRAGWVPTEDPMERASRDADRVRQWLSGDDRDFLVKTYAAVIAPPERGLMRSASCAVVAPEQTAGVPGLLAAAAQPDAVATRRDRRPDPRGHHPTVRPARRGRPGEGW